MEASFDLLGDPVDPNRGERGRPRHMATEQNRKNVMMLLAFGWSNPRIAGALGIDDKTLSKHYFRELKSRDIARDRVRMLEAEACWREVEAGNVAAIKEFGRIVAREDSQLNLAQFEEAAARGEPLGKKELQAQAAADATLDPEWGDDLVTSKGTPKPN